MKNRAFISYRRGDGGPTARWLHAKLSAFQPPDDWLERLPATTRSELKRRGLYYIDRAGEIPGSFWDDTIVPELQQSEYLIVLSTPSAFEPATNGRKNWLVREIETFVDFHGDTAFDRIIVALGPDAPEDRLPAPLPKDSNRGWADLRQVKLASWAAPGTILWRLLNLQNVEARHDAVIRASVFLNPGATESSERAVLQIWAKLFAVGSGNRASLYRIDAARRAWTRRLAAVGGSLAIFTLIAALGLALWLWHRASDERDLALRSQSRALAREAENVLQSGDVAAALAIALEALPRDLAEKDRPYVSEAERALFSVVANPVQERQIHRGHVASANGAKISPDGRFLLIACQDNTARLLEATTGREVVLKGHRGRILSVSFSPDGNRILTSSADTTARLWDAQGREVAVLSGHDKEVDRAIFSSDSQMVLTISKDMTARVWKADDGHEVSVLRGHTENIISAEFFTSDRKVMTASWDSTARIWDSATGKELIVLSDRAGADIGFGLVAAALSPDDKRIVTATLTGSVKFWDTSNGEEVLTLESMPLIDGMKYSPNSEKILVFSFSAARLLDARSGRQVAIMQGHAAPIVSAVFSADSKRVLTASRDRSARLWDAATGSQIAALRGHEQTVTSAVFSPTEDRVLTGSDDATARLWDIAHGQPLVLRHQAYYSGGVVMSSDGEHVLTASDDWTARLRSAVTGRDVATARGHSGQIRSAEFSADGHTLVTVSDDKTARVWEVPGLREVAVLTGDSYGIDEAHLSPNGHLVATVKSNDGTRLWNLKDHYQIWFRDDDQRKPVFSPDSKAILIMQGASAELRDTALGVGRLTLRGHQKAINGAVFSPDGRYILTASDDQTARLWDAASGTELLVLRGHTAAVKSVAFSPDGTRFLTASADWTARLWDACNGGEIAVLRGHRAPLRGGAFAANGGRIVTSDEDGTARLWNAVDGGEVAVLRGSMWDAVISPDGQRVLTSGHDAVRIWSTFDTTQSLIDHACFMMLRPLTADQRRAFVLEPAADKPTCGWHPDMKDKPPYTPKATRR